MYSSRTSHPIKQRQRGVALMIMLVIMVMGVVVFFVSSLSSTAIQIKRDEVTANALAQAKEALIAFAVTVDLPSGDRPGDLPCPDNHPLGSAMEGTPSLSCNLPSERLGRLPWKKLKLPDLRDGSGERLWYAVSTNYVNDPRSVGNLNSDTLGTITVRDSLGNVTNDGSTASGAVAIIIAPGAPLTRYDNLQQNRIAANYNDPLHYLDCTGNVTGVCNIEDNADFADGSATNGFILGRIKDASSNVVVNDQLLVVTQDNIMQDIQKRVAGEVKQCLIEYAALPQNMGRYPWAIQPSDFPFYANSSAKTFGRIPDTLFVQTCLNSGGNLTSTPPNTNNCSATPTTGMSNTLGPNCNIQYGTWWANWKEMVFYGLADAYKPNTGVPAANACNTAGACLTVSPDPLPNKKFVVIVAGKILTGLTQNRSGLINQRTSDNYLEAPNNSGLITFAQSGVSATFNDTVVFQ